MEILLNENKLTIDSESTLDQLLAIHLKTKSGGLAVAVNEVVIPKNEWNNYQLHQNDKVLLIKATQGG